MPSRSSIADDIIRTVKVLIKAWKKGQALPVHRFQRTVRFALEAGMADDELWEGSVAIFHEQQVLQTQLEHISEACKVHRGPGLRRAREIGRAARRMLREAHYGVIDAAVVEKLVEECRAITAA